MPLLPRTTRSSVSFTSMCCVLGFEVIEVTCGLCRSTRQSGRVASLSMWLWKGMVLAAQCNPLILRAHVASQLSVCDVGFARCRGRSSVAALASVVASVPQQTVAAVETTWVGTAELLQEAVDEGHQQVGGSVTGNCTAVLLLHAGARRCSLGAVGLRS